MMGSQFLMLLMLREKILVQVDFYVLYSSCVLFVYLRNMTAEGESRVCFYTLICKSLPRKQQRKVGGWTTRGCSRCKNHRK